MSQSHQDSPTTEQVEGQAAAWVLRMDRGLTATEQDEFLLWLTAAGRHGVTMARHRQNWARLNVLGHWRPEHSPRPNPDLLAPRSRLKVVRPTWLLPLALAASLALGIFTWGSRPASSGSGASPSPIASITQRTLEDGSVVELNRGAEISVLYTPGERRVHLERGEAHFTVAKNKERPFIVSAGGVAVRAVGTAFDVRLDPTAVQVLVTEGRIQVRPPTPDGVVTEAIQAVLDAGQRTSVPLVPSDAQPPVDTVTPAQADAILAWQPRTLDFTATPLLGIVSAFNRHNEPIRLVIEDPALARVEMSASLRSDNVEGFIRLLEGGFGVKAERAGDTITLRKIR
jgi:transmembrane sensor